MKPFFDMTVHNYKELEVWKTSMRLAKEVYLLTGSLPNAEKYGLCSQINRSAISIPSNIAEGTGRMSDKEFSRFLSISLGSSYELETQLILVNDLGLVDGERTKNIISELNIVQRKIFRLKQTIQQRLAS